jgi:hypothetical protein
MREVRAKHASLAAENHGMKLITTIEHFVKYCAFFSKPFKFKGLAKCSLALAVIVPGTAALGQQSASPALVGEVSLVLGKAYIESPQRDRRRVEVGSSIRVHDQIITGANGHVHVRFVDDALVSVRPNSQLEVVRYEYDPDQPDQSAVKLDLAEGVARTISGAAAKAARQRFRLNTPIAAIGVRGTDFVVSATPETVRALVNEGIIVMAPYSEGCTAEAFGPCDENAIELSDESLQVVELNSGEPVSTLATHERNPELLQENTALLTATNDTTDGESEAEEKLVSTDVYLESVTSIKVTADAQQVADDESAAVVPEPEPEPIIDFTPSAPLADEVLTQRQLVWGRWAWTEGFGDLERISVDWDTLPEDYKITVSTLGYGLYRFEGDRTARVDAGLGVVGFGLNSAQAFYSSDSGIVAMHVTDGSLNIDFDERTFATELALEHASTGLVDFKAMGSIVSGGYFFSRSDAQSLSGAVSLDGSEAGYYFDKQLDSGAVSGLTLWDSQ